MVRRSRLLVSGDAGQILDRTPDASVIATVSFAVQAVLADLSEKLATRPFVAAHP